MKMLLMGGGKREGREQRPMEHEYPQQHYPMDDEMEMRRRRRAYATRENDFGDDPMEMRRRRSRGGYEDHFGDDPAEMRRRSRGAYEDNWGDDSEMRRGRRARSAWDDSESRMDEMRRRSMRGDDDMTDRHMGYDTSEHMPMEARGGMSGLKQGTQQLGKAVPLDPSMESVLEAATKVLDTPPATWVAYLHKKDYLGIAKMEGKELMQALEAKKPAKEIRKELIHTMAALMQLAVE